MSIETSDDTAAELLHSLRLAQTALDDGFRTVIENGAPVDGPLTKVFFQILCQFRDSHNEFHTLFARGLGTTKSQ